MSNYEIGKQYPLTEKHFQSLVNITGTPLTAMLIGPVDFSRGRRLVKEPGDWEFWNEQGNKISFSINPNGSSAICSVSKDIDDARPEPLSSTGDTV